MTPPRNCPTAKKFVSPSQGVRNDRMIAPVGQAGRGTDRRPGKNSLPNGPMELASGDVLRDLKAPVFALAEAMVGKWSKRRDVVRIEGSEAGW